MKFSNFHKSNPNLLYNEFKGLEDYTQDDYLLLNFKKKNPSQKKNLPLLPIGLGAETSNLANNEDDYNNLTLKKQIELAMRPITSPNIKAQNIEKSLIEQDVLFGIKKEKTYSTERAYDLPKTSRLRSDLGGITSHDNHNERDHNSLQNSSNQLLPINGIDSFTTNNQHWKYHQPVKYNVMTPRNMSTNVSVISESIKKNVIDPSSTKAKHAPFTKHLKSHSQDKSYKAKILPSLGYSQYSTPGSKQHSGLPDTGKKFSFIKLPNEGELMASDILKQINDPKILFAVSLIKSKNISNLKIATNEVNHLLSPNEFVETLDQLDKTLLDLNQAKSQTILTDANKRNMERLNPGEGFAKEYFNESQTSIKRINGMSQKESQSFSPKQIKKIGRSAQLQKKEYYNKWFIPVKFWNVRKELNSTGRKYESLKKDVNHFYHNMHDYAKQNPLASQRHGGKEYTLKADYVDLQEKLKQNNSIRKYKKELLENQMRVPTCLNSIEEEDIN